MAPIAPMPRTTLLRTLTVVVVGLLLIRLFFFVGQRKRLFRESRTSLYTLVTITVVSPSETKAREAMDAAYDELERVGRLLNFYAPDSELSRINRNAGVAPVKVSTETLGVIQKAVDAAEETEGGFDVTVGPLVRLWDFKEKKVPSRESIDAVRGLIGFRHIVINVGASTVYLDKKGVQIDLGGIIKGYAADRAAPSWRNTVSGTGSSPSPATSGSSAASRTADPGTSASSTHDRPTMTPRCWRHCI